MIGFLLLAIEIIGCTAIIIGSAWDEIWHRPKKEILPHPPAPSAPFSVSAYLDRLERIRLDICEDQKPVDQTIILWWGLDGLTLDEKGKLKWISRKKKAPVN